MKNAILGIVITVIGIFSIFIVITIGNQMTRRNDLDNALAASVEDSVKLAMQARDYDINSNEEFLEKFLEILKTQISNDATLTVNVAGIDYEEGLLSVNVVETFDSPLAKEKLKEAGVSDSDANRKYECDITVVFDETHSDKSLKSQTFWLDDEKEQLYKRYQIMTDDDFITPDNPPSKDGKEFQYWKNEATGEKVTSFPETVTTDNTYIAVYK